MDHPTNCVPILSNNYANSSRAITARVLTQNSTTKVPPKRSFQDSTNKLDPRNGAFCHYPNPGLPWWMHWSVGPVVLSRLKGEKQNNWISFRKMASVVPWRWGRRFFYGILWAGVATFALKSVLAEEFVGGSSKNGSRQTNANPRAHLQEASIPWSKQQLCKKLAKRCSSWKHLFLKRFWDEVGGSRLFILEFEKQNWLDELCEDKMANNSEKLPCLWQEQKVLNHPTGHPKDSGKIPLILPRSHLEHSCHLSFTRAGRMCASVWEAKSRHVHTTKYQVINLFCRPRKCSQQINLVFTVYTGLVDCSLWMSMAIK